MCTQQETTTTTFLRAETRKKYIIFYCLSQPELAYFKLHLLPSQQIVYTSHLTMSLTLYHPIHPYGNLSLSPTVSTSSHGPFSTKINSIQPYTPYPPSIHCKALKGLMKEFFLYCIANYQSLHPCKAK